MWHRNDPPSHNLAIFTKPEAVQIFNIPNNKCSLFGTRHKVIHRCLAPFKDCGFYLRSLILIFRMKPWFVYILECGDGTLYTGITNDLSGRLEKHKAGKASKYTRSRSVKRLVYSEKFPTKSEALRREIRIKKLRRRQKLALLG